MKIGRKRQLNRSIEMLHQKSIGAYPLPKEDIPTPKAIVTDWLLGVPAQQRGHYIELLGVMAKIDESKLQDLSRKMVEYYSRYLPYD